MGKEITVGALPSISVKLCPTPVTPDSYGDILKRLANLENCVDQLCACYELILQHLFPSLNGEATPTAMPTASQSDDAQ